MMSRHAANPIYFNLKKKRKEKQSLDVHNTRQPPPTPTSDNVSFLSYQSIYFSSSSKMSLKNSFTDVGKYDSCIGRSFSPKLSIGKQ